MTIFKTIEDCIKETKDTIRCFDGMNRSFVNGRTFEAEKTLKMLKSLKANNKNNLLFYKRKTYSLLLEKSNDELTDSELDLMYNLSIDKDIQEFLNNNTK